MIKLLDRYILRELLGPFIYGLLAFSIILYGSTLLFSSVKLAIEFNIPWSTLVQIMIYKLPGILTYTLPMAMLVATISAISRLSGNSEIIALRAGGIGFNRIVIPVIAMGLFVSIFTVFFNEIVVPRATYSAEELLLSWTQKNTPSIKSNINLTEYDTSGILVRIINIGNIKGSQLNNITMAEYEKGKLVRVIRSKEGSWQHSGAWEFYHGIMHNFSPTDLRKLTVIEFEKERIEIKLNPLSLIKREKSSQELNSIELKKRIDEKRLHGADILEDSVNFHLKFSFPFASLIFSILGCSVALRPHRSTAASGIGLSLVIILLYYILLTLGMGLSLSGTLHPIIGAWLANVLTGSIGFYLLKRQASIA